MEKRLNEISARLAEIEKDLEKRSDTMSLDDINALNEEVTGLKEERKELMEGVNTRKQILQNIADGKEGKVIRSFSGDEDNSETRKLDDPYSTKEYRTAFLKNLLGRELDREEREAFVTTTDNTPYPLPATMVSEIWSLIENRHSILGDIKIYRTGTILEIVKHKEILQGKAKKTAQGAANDDEKNDFVRVTLSGNDFSKHVDISYAMSTMALPAFERYLIDEISSQLGEAMAEDVIAQIKTDMSADNNKAAAGSTITYAELAETFGLLKRANNVKVYCNSATFYSQLVAMVDTTGRPLFQPNLQDGAMGLLIGGVVKIEDACGAGEILIGDPERFVYNMVSDIMIENQKNIKSHVITYAGYARGEGALIDDKSFALRTATV